MNLGIYTQVPFCQTKCTYCNFHTGVVASSRFAPYVAAVKEEIESFSQLYQAAGVRLPETFHAASVDTVYIGGGTPSLLDPAHLQALLDSIRVTFSCELLEVTLEADPETIEPEKAEAWARAGINRISFGAQSFSDVELKAAGRMHRRADLYHAVPILREAGSTNISFDLIAGLPHQTAESWQQSLKELISLTPPHVSVYMMEIDEGSRLGREVLTGGTRYGASELPSDDEIADFYEQAQAKLAIAGYLHYEISNWALPGYESRHNLKYWRREPYLGFGAGAHSFSGTHRWANAHDPAAYAQAISNGILPVEQLEEVSSKQALEEELFLGLRQLAGVDFRRIERDYGVSLTPRLEKLSNAGLVELNGNLARLSPAKLGISNEVFVELLQ
ncbi:MAG TPA: radical SAM family heme chaperone HemW [Terriglobales bacterium]|nr:radical SAM family heme chaperone HemW [Terriglobales bacterium]